MRYLLTHPRNFPRRDCGIRRLLIPTMRNSYGMCDRRLHLFSQDELLRFSKVDLHETPTNLASGG